MNYTYVTLATKETYLIGANYLKQSLDNVNSKYPLIVLVTDNILEETIENILDKNIKYISIPYKTFQ